MQFPQTTTDFIAFMEDVWRGDCSPTPDGGVIITGSPLYDAWHDARRVAKAIGARKLYGSTGEYHYDMPDGSRVAISTNGASIREVRKHI